MDQAVALSFGSKTPRQVAEYLESKVGIPEVLCKAFEDEYVDGSAFIDLTENDVKGICNKVGPARKICRLIQEMKEATKEPPMLTESSEAIMATSQSATLPLSPQGGIISHAFNDDSSNDLFSLSDDNSSIVSSVSATSNTFNIPDHWRPSIMECINAQAESEACKLLTPTIRNEIVRDLMSQMYVLWPKPSRANCSVVAKKLVHKYPFMKDKGEGITGYGSWEKKLIDRVHNTSGGAKRKASGQVEGSKEAKKGRPKVSQTLSRYPPVSVSALIDESTVDIHIQKISLEMEKQCPRKHFLLPLMEQTYYSRREMIISESASLPRILATYSCLKLYSVIQQELDLILKKKNVLPGSIQEWKVTWVPAIISYADSIKTKCVKKAVKEATEAYEGEEDCDEKKALYLLVEILCTKKASLSTIYCEYQVSDNPDEVVRMCKNPTPLIACFQTGPSQPSYFIFIEHEIVTQRLTSFSSALFVWFATFFIYNLEYTKEVADVASFIQEFIFLLPCKRRKTATYLTATTGIKSFSQ